MERNRERKQQCKSRLHRQNRCYPLNSATLKLSDGGTHSIVEYDLARKDQDTVAASRQSIDADILGLPDLKGIAQCRLAKVSRGGTPLNQAWRIAA